ncbi:MAG: SH3 domain-containing protein, partial [Bacilli bacterium]
SLILGKVYNKEIYDILEIIKKDDYTWYKIKTGNNILGYIANKNGSNWVKLHEPIKEENDFIELYTCLKDDTYYIKLYQGEKLYLKK